MAQSVWQLVMGWNFLLSTVSRLPLWPTQPSVQCVLGTLSSGVKWLGCETDHSLPTSAEVKNMLIYTTTPPYIFMV
jgi:hypothetical protein